MDVMITKSNGESLKLGDLGINVKDFNVGSIPVTGLYGDVEGRAGTVDYGADLGQRTISVPFYMKANDMADYPLLRDELFSLVVSQEPFYVRELRRTEYQTGDNRMVGGKRYKVRISGGFDIDQAFKYGFGEISFETTDLPYAESIGSTQDIDMGGVSSDSDLWGFGMGLDADDRHLQYTHNVQRGKEFLIYNAGNVKIHPFQQFLRIEISDVVGYDSFFELKNETNGSVFRVNQRLTGSQRSVLDGANFTIDSLQSLRKTNRQFIGLESGVNMLSIQGAMSAKIKFDFRFNYL